jgi:dephospho-CoA kinase
MTAILNSGLKIYSENGPGVLALTGGIGSGKSTVAEIFRELGVPCIDADLVARTIHQDPMHPATLVIARVFPKAMNTDGKLSRGSLRNIFSTDQAANSLLKHILKPYVMEEITRWTQSKTTAYVVWESALMLDVEIQFDRLLVVDATDEIRISRVRQRNLDWTLEQIRKILAVQMCRETYLKRADDVIWNNGSLDELKRRVFELHTNYLNIWS